MLVAASADEAIRSLRPAGEPLSYRSDGIGRPGEVLLRPFYELYDRRHAPYLSVRSEAALAAREAEAARREVEARTVDAVVAGAAADEEAHALWQERSSASRMDARRCRSARYGGSWSYALRLPESGPAALRVSYWAAGAGGPGSVSSSKSTTAN